MNDERHALTDKIANSVWQKLIADTEEDIHTSCIGAIPDACSLYRNIWEAVRSVVAFTEKWPC